MKAILAVISFIWSWIKGHLGAHAAAPAAPVPGAPAPAPAATKVASVASKAVPAVKATFGWLTGGIAQCISHPLTVAIVAGIFVAGYMVGHHEAAKGVTAAVAAAQSKDKTVASCPAGDNKATANLLAACKTDLAAATAAKAPDKASTPAVVAPTEPKPAAVAPAHKKKKKAPSGLSLIF